MRPVVALVLACAALALPSAPADAAERVPDRAIVVVDVDGLLDPVSADLVDDSLREAERERAALLILTMDSPAAIDVDVEALGERIRAASVPVVAWVKGGGVARGGPALVAQAAHLTARAGNATLEGGVADLEAPTLRDLIAVLDGREVVVRGEPTVLELGEAGANDSKQVLPLRFRELDLAGQLQHALTSPFVALLLLTLGLCLIVFEFFAIGIGLAAAAGALLVASSFVGFAHLPVDWFALGRLMTAMLAISIDVQAGKPRFWASVGAVLLTESSLSLYDGVSHVNPPVWQVLLVVAGALVFLLPGLAAMIRARFSTPTIGREWMVGEVGESTVRFEPEGVITLGGAPWRARATRAAEIGPGDLVRVTAIRGLVLEVEPAHDQGTDRATDRPTDLGDDRATRDPSP